VQTPERSEPEKVIDTAMAGSDAIRGTDVAATGFAGRYNFLKIPENALNFREANVTWKDAGWEKIFDAVVANGYHIHQASHSPGYIFIVFERDA
jgi:hypothetical protein